jgi:hypothetical protein
MEDKYGPGSSNFETLRLYIMHASPRTPCIGTSDVNEPRNLHIGRSVVTPSNITPSMLARHSSVEQLTFVIKSTAYRTVDFEEKNDIVAQLICD